MAQRTLAEYLDEQRLSGTFTFFAVMVCAKPDELEQWKKSFHELVAEGVIVPVEQRLLGMRYRYEPLET